MKICATADLHGYLPDISPCDLLLIAGDVCPIKDERPESQLRWLIGPFAEWLQRIPAGQVVGIAGNHDFIMESMPIARKLPWTYLQDEAVQVGDQKIWGTPWVPNLVGWAFFGGMDRVEEKFDVVPAGTDIILAHGPMRGYGDRAGAWGDVGCPSMAEVVDRVRPRLFVCGHIHEGYGHYRHPSVEDGVFNVSHVNVSYKPVNPVVEIVTSS